MTTYTITESEYDQLIKLANKIICAGNGNLPGNSVGNDLGRDVIALLRNLQPNTQEPVSWHPTEAAIATLKRFEETCADNEGYDVPKDTMRNLQAIGLIYRTYGDMYCITDFGHSILTSHGVKP